MTDTIKTVTDWEQAAKWALKEIERKDALLKRALLLSDWLAETPHQRGSINGLAAQLQHAIHQEIEQ